MTESKVIIIETVNTYELLLSRFYICPLMLQFKNYYGWYVVKIFT